LCFGRRNINITDILLENEMSIKAGLNNILENNLDGMKQNFSAAITEKAMHKLEEKKIDIAKNYFAKINESKKPTQKA